MTRYIALLRAVNLGSHHALPMAELRKVAEEIGLVAPSTILQTGNLVFGSSEPAAALEARLEAELKARFGIATDVMVRDAQQWSALIAGNPFAEAAQADPSHLVVMPLKAAPEEDAAKALQAAVKGREQTAVEGDAAYIVYPDGIGRSKLTIAVIEKALGVHGTARNWNTVRKIGATLTGT